ncbi:MAG: Flp pilus assembly protein CpaB, partial [Myxococcales bacterium]|nr:Flp pilus assembly protein CpaB [Myxococcales bacterium]
PGVAIAEEDLVAVRMPPRFVPAGAFLTPEHVIGQRPRERVLANDLLRAERLANPESGQGLNAIIPRDMRAISVEIADGAALSGHLQPGNYVDVLVTVEGLADAAGVHAESRTATLIQTVFVLAVNEDAHRARADSGSGQGRPTVTFLVEPEQAEQIAHAERTGELRLSLRSDLDRSIFESHGVNADDVLGRKKEEKRTRGPRRTAPAPVIPVVPDLKQDCIVIVEGERRRVECTPTP